MSVYIDEILLWSNSGSAFTTDGNTENIITNVTDVRGAAASAITSGYKWLVQISNKSNASVTLSNYRLRLQAHYIVETSYTVDERFGYEYNLDGLTIAANSSIKVGWSGSAVTPATINNTEVNSIASNTTRTNDPAVEYPYINNHTDSGNIIIGTNFYLETYTDPFNTVNPVAGTIIDTFGTNSTTGSGATKYFNDSTLLNSRSGSNSYTSVQRKSTSIAPSTLFNSVDWEYQTGTTFLSTNGLTSTTSTATSNIYLDEVMLISSSYNSFTGIDAASNILNGVSINSDGAATNDLAVTDGFKWLIQVSNKSSDSITLDNIRLRLCTNHMIYDGAAQNDITEIEKYYDLKGIIIPANGSKWIGWAEGTGKVSSHTLNANNTTLYYINDKQVGSYISVLTRFYLESYAVSWNETSGSTIFDIFGNNAVTGAGSTRYFSSNELLDTRSGTNSYTSRRRKTSSTYPNTVYNADDWSDGIGTSYLSISAAGDPHIMTLNGEHYDFDYIGYLRYFDSNDNDRLIINVETKRGDYKNWKDNDYMRKLLLHYNDKTIIIDTGFRGKPVKVLVNDKFDFIEEKLDFHVDALRYAGYSNFKSNNEDKIRKYLLDNPKDVVPKFVRNRIKIFINSTYQLIIENVNEFNLQPCRIYLDIKGSINKDCKGLAVNRKWANTSKLQFLEDISYLEDPDPNQELPKLTIPSKFLNKKWN